MLVMVCRKAQSLSNLSRGAKSRKRALPLRPHPRVPRRLLLPLVVRDQVTLACTNNSLTDFAGQGSVVAVAPVRELSESPLFGFSDDDEPSHASVSGHRPSVCKHYLRGVPPSPAHLAEFLPPEVALKPFTGKRRLCSVSDRAYSGGSRRICHCA